MKHLSLLITLMFFTTLIFASSNKNRIRHHHPMNAEKSTFVLPCTEKEYSTQDGSYVCNGVTYYVQVTTSATSTADDCYTAQENAFAAATLQTNAAGRTILIDESNNCAGGPA